ncbi:MAG: NADAR family protein, partial [bacterium]|nr:NADAR family protein [bacterium]
MPEIHAEKYTYFYGADSVLSNFYPIHITADGVNFSSVEQYFQYNKAKKFGDTETATAILSTPSPLQQGQLGRRVNNFNEAIWVSARMPIMMEGLRLKFAQPALQATLLNTKPAVLVNTCMYDTVWGIGLNMFDKRAAY